MSDFTALVATGKWDRWAKVAADRGKYAAAEAVAFHTECQKFNATSRRTAFGAGAVQGGSGGVENVITPPADFTPDGAPYTRVLSTLTYFRTNGTKYPPFAALVVPAKHKDGAQVAFVGVHMPTRNTARRRDVWASCAGGLIALVAGLRKTGVHVVVGVDTNARWKNTADRKLLEQIATATGCHWAYETRVPSTRRSLIDNLLTDLPVRTVELIDPVASSDHPWTRIGLSIPASVTPTPAPVTPVEKPMSRLPSNLPQILRDAGLTVVEEGNWQGRGRPASTGGFAPVGVLCHHTATGKSTSDAATVRLLINGRSDLPGPLCHLGLARNGTVHVIAAGRANHAGKAKASGTVGAGDGNALYIGIEAFNDGVGEPWPAVQYDAYVKLCAVLSEKVTGNSVQTVRGHKETSVTGKVDPRFDMDAFRKRVAAEMAAPAKPTTTPPRKAPTVALNRMQQIKALLKEIIADPKTTAARRARCRMVDALLPPK